MFRTQTNGKYYYHGFKKDRITVLDENNIPMTFLRDELIYEFQSNKISLSLEMFHQMKTSNSDSYLLCRFIEDCYDCDYFSNKKKR